MLVTYFRLVPRLDSHSIGFKLVFHYSESIGSTTRYYLLLTLSFYLSISSQLSSSNSRNGRKFPATQQWPASFDLNHRPSRNPLRIFTSIKHSETKRISLVERAHKTNISSSLCHLCSMDQQTRHHQLQTDTLYEPRYNTLPIWYQSQLLGDITYPIILCSFRSFSPGSSHTSTTSPTTNHFTVRLSVRLSRCPIKLP